MSERIVVNTGPLVSLARIGCLEILPEIQLAAEQGISLVAIDEWKGRRAALAAGLSVTGSLGLLAKAKLLGLLPSLKPLLAKAVAEGIRYHPDLIRKVLEAVGEEPTP